MKQARNQTVKNPTKIWSILIGLSAITLYFNTQSMDPFNPPKLWVLILLASVLVGDIFIKRTQLYCIIKQDKIFIILILFITSLFVSALFSNQKYVAFFGDTQRKNGFIQYFCLTVIFIGVVLNIKKIHTKQVYVFSLIIGLILSFYGFMQHIGQDFISWNNPYNSVILTVGNPNFAAALMSILLVLNFTAVVDKSLKKVFRFIHLLTCLSLVVVIIFSDARQGLVAGAFGFAIFITLVAYNKQRKLGVALAIFGLLFGLIAILGMLQKGPLASVLYKGSVSIRGYYWRAAIEMFKHHPMFGVGVDSYGLYFKQYREPQYSLNYGFNITSSNAHNTFLQFFATGGFIVGITYLIFILSILVLALKKLVRSSESEYIFYAGILGAWAAYQAQSLISIDNINMELDFIGISRRACTRLG
jgi:O-antigen ligase